MKRKDLLGLDGVSREEITGILDAAMTMRQVVRSNNKKTAHLQGKSIVTLFYENSTRTRMSFELASKYMSAAAANISASASSVAKGETLIDTGVTLDQMGTDVIIIRHPMSGAPDIGWRMMITSVPIWSSVTPVSISVSPLATEDALAEMFAAAADMYLLASSKDMRVRVEFS